MPLTPAKETHSANSAPTSTHNAIGVYSGVRGLLSYIPAPKRKRLSLLVVGITSVAAIETLVLGVIAFFATVVTNPDAVLQSEPFQYLEQLLPILKGMTANDFVIGLGLLMIALVCMKNGVRAFVQYSFMKLMAFVSGYLGESLLEGTLRIPYSHLMRENTANLLVSIQFANNSGAFLNTVFMALSSTVFIFLMLAMLISTSPAILIPTLLVLGGPAYFLVKWMHKRLDRLATDSMEHKRGAMRHAMVALQGLKDVKVYGKEAAFCNKFAHEAYAWPRLYAKQDLLTNSPGWAMEIFAFILLFSILSVMYVFQGDTHTRVTGTLALLAVFAWRGLPAIIQIINSINTIRNTLPFVRDTLNHLEKIKKTAVPSQSTDVRLHMEDQFSFNSVSFRYSENDTEALTDINFTVKKGESLGIIGESGAGKSTIMDILIGLMPPTEGELMLDDKPLDALSLRKWTNSTGYIPQSPYIIDATLAENVAFGENPDSIDKGRLNQACAQAAVDTFVKDLPEGYDTGIGERGIRLSGGQQQRICIARALYRNPAVLLFDEATSSLDTKSEKQIQQTINGLKGKVTMVIVAHRLSTVEDCDSLVWVEQGRIKLAGRPETVLPEYKRDMNTES